MKVRPAAAADIPALLDLERLCSTAAHWSHKQYEDLFRAGDGGPCRLVLVVDETAECAEGETKSERSRSASVHLDGSVIGFPIAGFLIANQIGPEWELENIVVSPSSRRKGLATQLMKALFARAGETNSESVFLEVRESNLAARDLYRRMGFEESGRRKLYYSNPREDAVLYRLTLNDPSG